MGQLVSLSPAAAASQDSTLQEERVLQAVTGLSQRPVIIAYT